MSVSNLSQVPAVPGFKGLELIGEGATSRVYRAVETATGAAVAVKVLHPHLISDAVSVERFRREIEVTRALRHENIVAVYDLVASDGGLALVMELVAGETLKERIWRGAPLDWPVVRDLLVELLETLEDCHRQGVVHRDLKPQNLMLEARGSEGRWGLKLVDFGISRMSSFEELTRTGATIGSPDYMAPELFVASDFDPRADLYAVGVMAFEMLTGRLPYRADSVALLFHAHAHEPVPAPSSHRSSTGSELPPFVDAFVSRLLAKDPFDRYQTATEVLADLRAERVIASELPDLARRECLACGEKTLEALFVCTFCGYHDLETFLPGAFDVLISPDADRKALASFLAKLGRKGDADAKMAATAVLARGLDKTSAELLCEGARRHGVFASAEAQGLASRLGPAALTLGALALATPVLASLFPWLLDASRLNQTFHTTGTLLRDLFALGLIVALAVRGLLMLHGRSRAEALLSASGAPLAREYGWLNDLVPLLATFPNGRLRGAASRLVEKHFRVRELSPRLPVELSRSLGLVLRRAVELAHVLAEADVVLDRVRPEAPAQRELLELADRRARLGRHLAETTSLFNRLVTEAVSDDASVSGIGVQELEETRAALERQIEAGRAVRRELERFV